MPIDAYHRQLAMKIRDLAERKKMSLNRLADFAEISRSQLGRVLRGEQSPKLSALRKIAEALGVSTRELLPPTG